MGRKRRISKKSFDIPSELLVDVLARLPVKSLLKFRCVSKDWLSLIESPNFNLMHLRTYNRKQNPYFLIEGKFWSQRQCLIRRSDTFRRTCELVRPESVPGFDVRYVNGLVLLNNFVISICALTLWNPSLRKAIDIPPPPSSPDHRLARLGLGFDSIANDVKVVVVTVRDTPIRDCPPPNRSQRLRFIALVEVFSVKNRTWKGFTVCTSCVKSLRLEDMAIFLNGAIHWIGCDMRILPYPLYGSHVMSFNVETEKFNYFRLPWSLDDRSFNRSRVLGVLGESLVLLDMFSGRSEIWVMGEYGVDSSWSKRYTFDLEFDKFLHFRSNGDLLVLVNRHEVKKYDIETQEVKDLAKAYRSEVLFVDVYVESLLLLKQGDSLIDNRGSSNFRPIRIAEVPNLED